MSTKTNTVSTDVWAIGLLEALNAPVTTNNVTNVKTWLHQEQSASSWGNDLYNPLGVERNGVVTPYANVQQGIEATATLINNSYPQIHAALKQNRSSSVFATSVINSGWNTGYYGATGLANWLAKGPLNASGETSTGPGNEVSRLLGDLHLPGGGVVQDISSGVTGAGKTVVHTVTGAVSGTATFFNDITSGAFWKRIGIFAGGGVLFALGLGLFITSTKPGNEGTTTIAQVATEAIK